MSFSTLCDLMNKFGVAGIILIVWYVDSRYLRRVLDCYRHDVDELRRMNEDYLEIARRYEATAKNLQDVVITNTQAITRLVAHIERRSV